MSSQLRRPLRVAVVGCGTAGPVAALLLARDGHEVTNLERVAEPRGVGAGILLQRLGQEILDHLGLAEALRRRSAPVRRVDARTATGRRVMDFRYDDVVADSHGWGVHRAVLFDLLWEAVHGAGIPVETGVQVDGLSWTADGCRLRTAGSGDRGPFDLVIAADGARSRMRKVSGLATKDTGYPYGALWSVVPDPDGLAGDVLFQRYRDTRVTFGVLPTGIAQTSIFWSVRTRDLGSATAARTAAWAGLARPYAGELAPLVDRVGEGELLPAGYRDVVVRSPVLVRGGAGLVLMGDAAHAMSPQLGLGASLALADAWTLAACLRARGRDLPLALHDHDRARRAHIRYYRWCSRLMTPVFQSDLVPIGWARDLLAEPVARIPWVRRQFVTTLMGIRTSPWTTWTPPSAPVTQRGTRS